jgi:anaerobic ribonucleoside-triphosphate reductase
MKKAWRCGMICETIEEYDAAIAVEKEKLKNVKGTKCEVYSRIIGYYRPLSEWNAGKKEEWQKRKNYKWPVK